MATKIAVATTNAIVLNEIMETLIPTIRETFSKGKDSEKTAYNFMAQSVVSYRDCGKSLSELKDEFKKDGYTKQRFDEYIDETFDIKVRMSQRYIQLATNKRTKDVDVEFFSKMNKPTLTNVITALSFNDTDWEKVINGDDTPFIPKKQTDDEKETALKKAFDKHTYEHITFDNYKKFEKNSKDNLIQIIDRLTSQTNIEKVDIELIFSTLLIDETEAEKE